MDNNSKNNLPVTENDETVLKEIIEYVLSDTSKHDAIINALEIKDENGRNVIMLLLEKQQFDDIQKLFAIGGVICGNSEFLSHVDHQGQNLLAYFFMYANTSLIAKFIELLKNNADKNDVQRLVFTQRFDHKTPLMVLCSDSKIFSTSEEVENQTKFIEEIINNIVFVLGLDALSSILTSYDIENNNIVLILFKRRKYDIINILLDITDKAILDDDQHGMLVCDAVTHCDNNGDNLMMLSCISEDEELHKIFKRCLKIIETNSAQEVVIRSFTVINGEKNNVLMLTLIGNIEFAKKIFAIIKSIPLENQKILWSQICTQFNREQKNIIVLSLIHSPELYITITKHLDSIFSQEAVTKIFSKTLETYPELLHTSLETHDPQIVSDVLHRIKSAKKDHSLSQDDKSVMNDLLTRRDKKRRNSIMYAAYNGDKETFSLMLDLVKNAEDKLLYKILLTDRDIENKTIYMISKIQKQSAIAKEIEAFAKSTDNEKYIEQQKLEIEHLQKYEGNILYKLAFKKI